MPAHCSNHTSGPPFRPCRPVREGSGASVATDGAVSCRASRHGGLLARHPPPFAAYRGFAGRAAASVSPERVLRLDAGTRLVEARPIKGTRPRGATPDRDAALARELVTSEKDRAENVMIVDLLRN